MCVSFVVSASDFPLVFSDLQVLIPLVAQARDDSAAGVAHEYPALTLYSVRGGEQFDLAWRRHWPGALGELVRVVLKAG
jgi:hypothetical protein